MNKFAQNVLFATILFFLILFIPSKVSADGEFETDYKVNYSVSDSGGTNVTAQVNLENKTANFYAEKFELKIGSTQVVNVNAQDAVGPLETEVKFEDNITTIGVKFNQRVIGLGKTLPWTLSYTSSELATKSGQIWEISIPKLAKSSEIGTYEAVVVVPSSFGPNAFAFPTPLTTAIQGKNQTFTFNKEQLTASGISMSFGEKQVFDFDLSYYISNPNLTAQTQEIVLPPDNNYQQVVLTSIEPQPLDVVVDKDGNFLAKYRLGPKSSEEIKVKGFVEVFSKPFRKVDLELTEQERNLYLQPQKYWETDASVVKERARELKTPKQIYDFVSTYLTYSEEKLDQENIERLGAQSAYSNPKAAVCMEFTDLFIAIARASGIPSREVVGYAYTQNTRLRPLSFAAQGDLLHAWPEYWDEELGWVQIDPTWGATSGGLDYFNKLDFNHITLAQRGVSSTQPYPAGSYKKENEQHKKDVVIEFAQSLPSFTSAPDIEIEKIENVISGIPFTLKTRIRNIGSTSILPSEALLSANVLSITSENPQDVEIMPPFSQRNIDFTLQGKSFFRKDNDTIVLSFRDTQASLPVKIVPFYYLAITPQFAVSIFLAAVIITFGVLLYNKLHRNKFKFPTR